MNCSANSDARHVSQDELARVIVSRHQGVRQIIAIAGPPGSGKSTLAEGIAPSLNSVEGIEASILPMDGFHFDDIVLEDRGLKARKGAPETFDVAGLKHLLERLHKNIEQEVAVPVFDRDLEISRGAARIIKQEINIILVEGNYLLLNDEPWRDLSSMFDITIEIQTDEQTLRERLRARWEGYALTEAKIEAKLEGNDLPNGRHVLARSARADFVVST